MKQRLLVALLTVLVFAAGFAARMWTESDRPVPPPPSGPWLELTGAPSEKKAPPQSAPKPYNRAQLVAEIEKLRPQIDAFRARIDAIDAEYEQDFVKILNPEQRRVYDAKLADWQKRKAEHESKAAAQPPPPLSDEEIAKLRQRPFEYIYWKVSPVMKLEQVTRDYKLDTAQQARERELLAARRDKVIALLDTTPPPTIRMFSLAPMVERLADPSVPQTPKSAPSGK